MRSAGPRLLRRAPVGFTRSFHAGAAESRADPRCLRRFNLEGHCRPPHSLRAPAPPLDLSRSATIVSFILDRKLVSQTITSISDFKTKQAQPCTLSPKTCKPAALTP